MGIYDSESAKNSRGNLYTVCFSVKEADCLIAYTFNLPEELSR
jgi:hypothetical protein